MKKPSIQLLDLLQRIKVDPNNAGYLFLLSKYKRPEIIAALDELGY